MQIEDPIYGNYELPAVLSELIQSKLFQRLKGIHQGGAIIIARPEISLTRYEHSIGVMLLIKKLGGNLKEQIAGLLHDISHTAFSHLADYVLGYEHEDYHEQIYPEYLADREIVGILANYGLDFRQFLELDRFTLLDYPMPSLCADRIDYTLRDLYHLKKIRKADLCWFVDGLRVSDGRIFVASQSHADWFQIQFEYLNREYFNSKDSQMANQFMIETVKRYHQQGQIDQNDFAKNDLQFIAKIENLSGNNIRELYHNWQKEDKIVQKPKFKKRQVSPDVISPAAILND